MLLATHGLARSKDDAGRWARIVGSRGIAVFAIDMPCHGERATEDADWHVFRDQWLGPICMRRTVVDNLRALDYLRTRQDLDVRAIPLLGASMGANLGGHCGGPGHRSRRRLLHLGERQVGARTRHLPAPERPAQGAPGCDELPAVNLAPAGDPRELFVYRGGHVPDPEAMEIKAVRGRFGGG